MAATIKTMRTYLTLRQSDSFNQPLFYSLRTKCQSKMAATIKTMRTYLTLRQSDSFNQSFQRIELQG